MNPNQYHSCAKHSVETPFQGKPAHVQASFDRLRAMVEQCGPVKLVPYADRVGFMVRVRFAAAVPKTRWLDVGFWLRRRVESPRFRRVQTISPDVHVHLLRVTRPQDLDDEVMGWVRESYRVGAQERG